MTCRHWAAGADRIALQLFGDAMLWNKALLAAAISSLCGNAQALEPEAPPAPASDASDKHKLDTIIVKGTRDEGLKAEEQTSAAKMPLSLRETPQSITVITQESLRDRQVFDLGQALEMSAGVNQFSGTGPFGGMSSFGFSDVTIRGISIDGYNDVREDGFINNSYFTLPDMAIYDRIEVVKGPNAVTYGRGSVGGMINRVRKKPLDSAETDVELSVGSFDNYRVEVDATGPMFSTKSVRGRLIAAFSDEGSFVEGVKSKRYVVAPSLAADITASTRLLLEGLVQIDRFTGNTGFPLVQNADGVFRAPNIARTTFVGEPTVDGNHWSIYSGALQLDQDLNDHWLSTLRLSGNKTHNQIRNDRYAYGFYQGYTSLSSGEFDIGNTIWSGELRLAGHLDLFGRPVKLVAGAEFSHNDYHRSGRYLPYPYSLGTVDIYKGNFGDLPSQALTDSYQFGGVDKNQGYYVQAQIRPIDRLSVLLGARYDKTESTSFSETSGSSLRKKDDAVTGRIGLTYDFNKQISAYTLYAQSFLPVLYSFDQNGSILDPETGEIYEMGLKTEWLDRRVGVNAATYRINRDHIPTQVPVPPGQTPYAISSGLQRSQGAELELNGEPIRGWKMSLAVDTVRSEYKDPNDPLYGAKPGGMANWQFSTFSSYELQSGVLHGLGAGMTIFAIPERGLSPFQRGTLEGYERVDLHLFYTGLRNLEFRLLIRNLLDARYVEGADRIGGNAQFGSPLAALLSVHYALKPH
jgi:iron complex outermembrane recepter protein